MSKIAFRALIGLSVSCLCNLPAHSDTPDLDRLRGSTWQWVEIVSPVERFMFEYPEQYTLDFASDGVVQIKADCNRARGSYTVSEDGSITLRVGPMTKAECPPGSHSDEFVEYLGHVARFFFKDANLLVDMVADGGTLHFRSVKSAAPSPEGPHPWYFVCGDGQILSATYRSDPDQGSVELNALDGRKTLPHVPSGSGSKYAKGDTVFWGRGSEAIYQVNKRSTTCSRIPELKFESGTATATGSVSGYQTAVYLIEGYAGQELDIDLAAKNSFLGMTVWSGATLSDIEGGPMGAAKWSSTLPKDAEYLINIGLSRAEARRKGVGKFSLTVTSR